MVTVTVTIDKLTGIATIRGEGFETTSLKKRLEDLGLVVERHEGHAHVHDAAHAHAHQHTGSP